MVFLAKKNTFVVRDRTRPLTGAGRGWDADTIAEGPVKYTENHEKVTKEVVFFPKIFFLQKSSKIMKCLEILGILPILKIPK